MSMIYADDMHAPRFEVKQVRRMFRQAKEYQYHVLLIAANGEVLSDSEMLNSMGAVWTNIYARVEVFGPGALCPPVYRTNGKRAVLITPPAYIVED